MPLSPYKFGEFELDDARFELRRNGQVVKIERIPMDLLILLAEKDGNVVTRQEIIDRLWGKDVFVDTEHGINTAVRKIRQALRDDPEHPRYVQTVTGKGYRFIAPANGNGNAVAVEPLPQAASRSGSRKMLPVAAFGLLLLLAFAGALIALNVRGWRDRIFARPINPPVQALAVLPLANMSSDPGQEYFADGMTEALITELGRVSRPRVISRQSVMQYKGSKKPLQEIARELNVDAVLEGAVERSGDRVRVTVHLERVSPESQVWANEYSRGIRDVIALEDEIARAVTDEIQAKLTREERARLSDARPVNPEAHDYYLLGLYQWNKATTGPELETGIRYFEQAVEKDPSYARAYVGLSDAYRDLGHPANVGGRPPKETLPKARAAVTKALELDPSLGEAHSSLATLIGASWDWQGAEKEHRLAIQLAPNYAAGHAAYGSYLSALGRNDEALTQYKYAIELDPDSFWYRIQRANALLTAGQYDPAIKEYEALQEYWGVAMACMIRHMYPEAIAAAEMTFAHTGRRDPMNVALLAEIYGLAGKRSEGLKLIEELKEMSKHAYVSPTTFAWAYTGLGDRKMALDWLDRGYQEDDEALVMANVGPPFSPLRSEPRFQALLRRMNFPP